jgi:excisionase family DNA binding protein
MERIVTQHEASPDGRWGYSFGEVAERLGLSIGFLRLEASRGNLRTRRLGRRVVILASDLADYLRAGD